jgi:hypothetical protein
MESSLLEKLKEIRDEIILQAHLLTMDSKDKLEELEVEFDKFEKEMEKYLAEFGKFNEDFWVGSEEKVNDLVKEYKSLKLKQ